MLNRLCCSYLTAISPSSLPALAAVGPTAVALVLDAAVARDEYAGPRLDDAGWGEAGGWLGRHDGRRAGVVARVVLRSGGRGARGERQRGSYGDSWEVLHADCSDTGYVAQG